MAEAVSQDTGPISENDAIAAIVALDAPEEAQEAVDTPAEVQPAEQPEAAETAADEPEGAVDEPITDEGGAEPDEEPAETELELLNPPEWWDAEAKAAFKAIPNTPAARVYALQMQRLVGEAEAKREAITQKVKAEAQTARQEASRAAETMRGIIGKLDGVVPEQEAVFQEKYGNLDWNAFPAWARENPAEANQFLAEYNAEKARIEHMRTARAEAESVSRNAFIQEQTARLREIAPELAANPENLRALGTYLGTTGIPAEAVREASAEELVILNKARLWDELQTKAAATASSQKPKAPPVKTVRPVAAQNTGSFKQRQAQDAIGRLKKTGSEDDAVAAIMALGL